MSDTYQIKSLDDFLNVPEDRIDACLYEFKTTLMAMRIMRALNADLGHGETVMILFPSFTWVDDGKMDMSVQIQTLPVRCVRQASGETAVASVRASMAQCTCPFHHHNPYDHNTDCPVAVAMPAPCTDCGPDLPPHLHLASNHQIGWSSGNDTALSQARAALELALPVITAYAEIMAMTNALNSDVRAERQEAEKVLAAREAVRKALGDNKGLSRL